MVNRTDDVWILIDAALDVFTQCFAGYGHGIGVNEVLLGQLIQYGVYTAGFIQVFHISMTSRSQMTQIRGFCTDGICHIQVDFDAAFIGDCWDMQHAVGGAAQCHIRSQRIFKCICGHNVTWTDVFPVQIHNRHTCFFCQLDSFGINSRNGTVALESHAEYFGQAVHGVCGIHTGAGTTGRTCFIFKFFDIFQCEFTSRVGTNCFKHAGKAGFLPLDMASQHRAAADKYGRYVDSGSCHQQARNVLVAVWNHNQCIEMMRQCHTFGGIGNQVSGYEGVFHADMSHCNAVADCNCREDNRCAACHSNAHLDCFYDFINVHVTGNNFVVGRNDSNERTFHFFFGHSQGIKKRALRCLIDTITIKITTHC